MDFLRWVATRIATLRCFFRRWRRIGADFFKLSFGCALEWTLSQTRAFARGDQLSLASLAIADYCQL